MSTTKKTERVLPTIDQLAELLRIITTLVTKIFKRLDRPSVQYWIGNTQELFARLTDALVREPEVVDETLSGWVKFYREVFGLELDLAQVKLPAEREGFCWLVLVAKGLTMNQVFKVCCMRFAGKERCYPEDFDFDRTVTRNDREPTETYVIRVRDRVVAAEEPNCRFVNATDRAGIKGITVLERMLLELWYYWQTSKHIDVSSFTLCSGSCSVDGSVPYTYCNVAGFNVSRVFPEDGHWQRVREVVSLP